MAISQNWQSTNSKITSDEFIVQWYLLFAFWFYCSSHKHGVSKSSLWVLEPWNGGLPTSVRQCSSVTRFKSELKTYLFLFTLCWLKECVANLLSRQTYFVKSLCNFQLYGILCNAPTYNEVVFMSHAKHQPIARLSFSNHVSTTIWRGCLYKPCNAQRITSLSCKALCITTF